MGSIRTRWAKYRSTFEWLSSCRTLRGIWFERLGDSHETFKDGAQALLRDLALSAEDLRSGIRDTLLALWRRWDRRAPTEPARLLLQQDIATAVEFLQVATDEPVDFDDPFWGIPLDRRRGRWAALPEALPFEGDNARRLFPTRAMHYLGDFNGAIPLEHRFDNARIEKLIKAWWPASVALRRFCLAFERLHQHDAGQINEDNLVQLSEETPTEFLLLCALHTERLITERYLQTPPRSSKTPGFGRLMLETAAEIKAAFGIADPAFEQELACALEERTKLHDLAHNPRDPFIPATEFATSDPTARAFLRCLTNFAIMRNYAAHHDCLDRDLYSNRWVAAPVEAMVATVLATLTLPR